MSDGVEQPGQGTVPSPESVDVSALKEKESAEQEPASDTLRQAEPEYSPENNRAEETATEPAAELVDAGPGAPDADLQAARAAAAAELAEMAELVSINPDITPIRLRMQWFYIADPTIKERRSLVDFFIRVEKTRDELRASAAGELPAGPDGNPVDPDREVLETMARFVCRYDRGRNDLVALSADELEGVLGLKGVPRVVAALLGAPGNFAGR